MKLTQLPGLTFASADIDQIDSKITAAVENILGRKLARADPLRLFLRGIEQVMQQQRLLIDQCAKENLLAYATGDYLDHIGALIGVHRFEPKEAGCTMELTLSAKRLKATTIPAGTRFTAGDGVFFALEQDAVIPANQLRYYCHATCTAAGTIGNDYAVGEINQIVDPQQFLAAAVNITSSDGGSELETDDAFRERIHEAPESFSVAGPYGAYKWFAMSASALISDVSVMSPAPGVVDIRPLLVDGQLPSEEILELVRAACNDRAVRPLTDKVIVAAPEPVEYSINLEYYISRAQAASANAINLAAQNAVNDFILWQRAVLGRDINPTELIHRLRAVGVKRVDLFCPDFTVLKDHQVAIPKLDSARQPDVRASFLGLEED